LKKNQGFKFIKMSRHILYPQVYSSCSYATCKVKQGRLHFLWAARETSSAGVVACFSKFAANNEKLVGWHHTGSSDIVNPKALLVFA